MGFNEENGITMSDGGSLASPRQLIGHAMPRLGGATRRVAEQILADPGQVGRMSIIELAKSSGSSTATVTRLAVALGFAGYPALRAAIATDTGRDIQAGWENDIGGEISLAASSDQVLEVLAGTQSRAMRDAAAGIDLAVADRVADAMAQARRIHLYGEWGDEIPARELYFRLLRIGLPVWLHTGLQESRIGGRLMREGDVALIFSRGEGDASRLEFAGLARGRKALTAVITGTPDGELAGAVDCVLFTGTRQNDSWTDFFAGRASDALIAGLLWVLVAQRVPEAVAEMFEQTHGPDGAISSRTSKGLAGG